MSKKNSLLQKGKRKLAAIMVIAAITSMTGLTANAAIKHTELDEWCTAEIVLNTSAGESWLYERETIILPDGYAEESYGNHSLRCNTCGLTPVRWSLMDGEELPEGLSLSRSGVLSGTPREPGEYQFAVHLETGRQDATPPELHPESYADAGMSYVITIHEKRDKDTSNNKSSSSRDRDRGSSVSWKMGWTLEGDDWYYYIKSSDGSTGKYKGWHQDPQDNFWYYLDLETGKMYTGWHEIDGKEYFFNPDSPYWTWEKRGADWFFKGIEGSRPKGSMYCNEQTPDGSFVNETGAKVP